MILFFSVNGRKKKQFLDSFASLSLSLSLSPCVCLSLRACCYTVATPADSTVDSPRTFDSPNSVLEG